MLIILHNVNYFTQTQIFITLLKNENTYNINKINSINNINTTYQKKLNTTFSEILSLFYLPITQICQRVLF